jgi:TrmH family RNA methyltransferase
VHRDRANAFLVEGPLAVAEALKSQVGVDDVFAAAHAMSRDVAALAAAREVPVTFVRDEVLAALSDTTTPQGVVAVVAMPSWSIDDLPARADLVLVLAEVRDPGNAGTLVRSAVAAGASGVVFTPGAVDPWHPKTVRATAGALFHVPVIRHRAVDDALQSLRRADFVVIGADAASTRPLDSVDLTRRVALVVGNEAWGLPSHMRHLLDEDVGIPMPGPVDSLNVGIAGSILLFEAVRQRRLSSAPQ